MPKRDDVPRSDRKRQLADKREPQAEARGEHQASRDAAGIGRDWCQELIANIPDVVWTADASGNAVFISPNIETFFGFTQEEVYRSGEILWFGRIHPDDVARVRIAYERLFSQGERFDIEYRIQRKDGEWVWWHDRAMATYERDGVKYTDGLLSDVTKRRRAEIDVHDVTERLDLALKSAHAGTWTVDLPEQRTFCDEHACRLFGLDPGTVVDGFEGFMACVHPEDRERLRRENRKWIKHGVTFETEHRVVWPDGTVRFIAARGEVRRDENGRAVRMAGVSWDITGRRQAELELRASEKRYRQIFETELMGSFVSTPEGRLVECNAAFARIYGFASVEEALECDTNCLYPDRQSREAFLELLRNDKRLAQWEFETRRCDGTPIYTVDFVDGTFDEAGNLVLINGCCIDVTERKRAEDALRQSQKQFEVLVNTIDGIVWEADAQTFEFTFVSKRAESLLGYPVERWLGDSAFWAERVHEDDRAWAVSFCRSATRECRDHEFEYRMVAADGRIVWIRDIVTVVTQDGLPVSLRGVMVDTTEQKLVEIAMRESERRYRDLFETAVTGNFVSTPEGRLVACNRAFATMFGFSSIDEALSENLSSMYLNPPDRDVLIQQLRRDGQISDYPVLGVRRDGTALHIREHAMGTFDSDGTLRQLTGFLVDDTERKQREESERHKTEQLEAITDAMAAFLVGGDWKEASALVLRGALRQTASEYGFAGIVCEGPALRMYSLEVTGWDAPATRDFYDQAMATYKEVGYVEFTKLDNLLGEVIATGRTVLCNDPSTDSRSGGVPPGHPPLRHFLGVPFLKGEEVIGMIGVANRLGGYSESDKCGLELLAQTAGVLYESYLRSEGEEALQQQLLQSQKMEAVGRLAGGIAHDFNNLLTVITGYSDLMLKSLREGDPLRQNAQEIREAADRAASLTRQLLAFSRKQRLEPRVIDLNDVVQRMERMLRRLIGEDIELMSTAGPELWKVKADVGQIEQVIVNLAVNARDAMPDGGLLVIETANVELGGEIVSKHDIVPPGPYVRLTVTDTGCGIDAETRGRVFEPFFTTKEQGKGTGLGLSTVYGIVKQSGGYIWVYSEPDHGTAFKMYLPRSEEAVAPLIRETGTDRFVGDETILLVEDEQSVRTLVRETLRATGYNVLEAAGGWEALSICERYDGPIHLVLTDMVMPRMSGRELVGHLEGIRPGMKVMYMSGFTEDMAALQGLADEGTTFLEKPFTPDDLRSRVRKVLEESR